MPFIHAITVVLGLLTPAESGNSPAVRPVPVERNSIRSVERTPVGCRAKCSDRRIDASRLVPIPDPIITLKKARRIA